MGLMGAIANGYWKAMPGIDSRDQRDIENARADEKQRMWLAQQQRQQDAYDAALKEKAANRILAANPGLLKGYQEFEGPLSPERQQALDYATPSLLQQSVNYKTDVEKFQDFLDKYRAQKVIDLAYRPADKPGTDVVSLFKRIHNRMPKDDQELGTFAQLVKGNKNGFSYSVDENGNARITFGNVPAPGGLTKSTKTKNQKELIDKINAMDVAKNVIGNIDLDWFQAMDKMLTAAGTNVDFVSKHILPQEWKDAIATRKAGLSSFANMANERIHALTGARMSEFEAKRLLEGIPNPDDKPQAVRGKLLAFYNYLAMAEARAKMFETSGIPLTEKSFNSWKDADKDKEKAAILYKYGYKPVTLKEIDKMIGANLKGNNPSLGESDTSAPTATPISAPDVVPSGITDPQARTNAWLNYANE